MVKETEEGSRTQSNKDGAKTWDGLTHLTRSLFIIYTWEYTPHMKTWLCCGAEMRNRVVLESQQSTLTFYQI